MKPKYVNIIKISLSTIHEETFLCEFNLSQLCFTYRLNILLQLSQVDTTLSTMPKGSDRDNLLSLKSDIEELISLTRESLRNLEGDVENKNEDNNFDDETENLLDREYAMFKVCLKNANYCQRSSPFYCLYLSYFYY